MQLNAKQTKTLTAFIEYLRAGKIESESFLNYFLFVKKKDCMLKFFFSWVPCVAFRAH